MKKALLGVFAAAVLLSSGATTALASRPQGGHHFATMVGNRLCDNMGSRCIHADANNDGFCDVCNINYGSCPAQIDCGRNFVDADNDGVCDNAGGICAYTDADNDGICDVCGTIHENCPAGTGCGRNFVDADNDGVCDNAGGNNSAAASGYHHSAGRGNRGHSSTHGGHRR